MKCSEAREDSGLSDYLLRTTALRRLQSGPPFRYRAEAAKEAGARMYLEENPAQLHLNLV